MIYYCPRKRFFRLRFFIYFEGFPHTETTVFLEIIIIFIKTRTTIWEWDFCSLSTLIIFMAECLQLFYVIFVYLRGFKDAWMLSRMSCAIDEKIEIHVSRKSFKLCSLLERPHQDFRLENNFFSITNVDALAGL